MRAHFALQLRDVQRQLATPEVDAVPVERALLGDEARRERRAGCLQRQRVTLGVALGHDFQPEIVIEAQVEQRAVHVEQHGVDFVPARHRSSVRESCAVSYGCRPGFSPTHGIVFSEGGMELGWGLLTVILLAAAVVWFWQDSLAARESANAAAKEACERLSLQFLDGTVAFARLALVRVGGVLKLRRTYVFDYTATSIERRQGFVLLTGRRVESVGYAPGDVQPDARLVRPEPVAPHSNGDGGGRNVLELRDLARAAETAGRRPLSARKAWRCCVKYAAMTESENKVETETFRRLERLRELRIEHRDLDDVINRLQMDLYVNEVQLRRLKKRKLMLKDQIARLESELIPDLNA